MIRAVLGLAAACLAAPALAGPCDYRPSELVRGASESGIVDGAQATVSGLASRAGGFFTLSGLTGGAGLGSGATGTGTLGQIGSAAGAVGNAAAGVLAAPSAVLAGTVAAVGLGAYEGICYFGDERVTDYDEVLTVMGAIAASSDPALFRVEAGPSPDAAEVVLTDGAGGESRYAVRDLYILNGTLMHRGWGPDREIGDVGYVVPAASE